jgi:hypothetical protein
LVGRKYCFFNQLAWSPLYASFAGKVQTYYLVGCRIAFGKAGSDFLFAIAQALGCRVMAPTNFTWTDGSEVWVDEGTLWKTATPTSRPPDFLEEEVKLESVGSMNEFVLATSEGYKKIPPDQIIRVVIRAGYDQAADRARELIGSDISEFMNEIGVSQPFEPGGEPGSILTGLVEITVAGSTHEETRVLEIHDDSVLRDSSYRKTFYRVSPNIARYVPSRH